MNERILELRKQAGELGINDITGLEGDKLVSKFLEKFAELLIRECLSLARSYPSQNDDYAAGIDSVRDSIKQHFGVE